MALLSGLTRSALINCKSKSNRVEGGREVELTLQKQWEISRLATGIWGPGRTRPPLSKRAKSDKNAPEAQNPWGHFIKIKF